MSRKEIEASNFSPDMLDLFNLLDKYQVEYVIIGGMAVIFYGHVRLTGDVDIYFSNSEENIHKLYNALFDFWDGNIPSLTKPEELKRPDLILQYGVPPNRIDLINTVDGITFSEAWQTREEVSVNLPEGSLLTHFISLELLIRNKEKVQRRKDLDDLEFLKAAKKKVRSEK